MEKKMFHKMNPRLSERVNRLRNNTIQPGTATWRCLQIKTVPHNENVKQNDSEEQKLLEAEGVKLVMKQIEIVIEKIQTKIHG